MSAPTLKDVTDQVDFGDVDAECLPLTECVCGERFRAWDQVLGVYPDRPWVCPKCNTKLVFSNAIKVYQVQ